MKFRAFSTIREIANSRQKARVPDPKYSPIGALIVSGLVLGASVAPAGAVAIDPAIAFYDVTKIRQSVQFSPDAPIEPIFYFLDARVGFSDNSNFSSVEVVYRDPISSNSGLLSPLTLNPISSTETLYRAEVYNNQNDLDTDFPNGFVYDFQFSGNTLDGQVASLVFPDTDLYPLTPTLTGTTFSRLQGFDPSRPFTFTFDGFAPTVFPNTTNDITLQIIGEGDPFTAIVPNSATSIEIPADTLLANVGYSFVLDYRSITEAGNFNGTSGFGNFVSRLTGNFFTGDIFIPDPDAPGDTPTNPILPTPTPGIPGFNFSDVPVNPARRFFFDPDVAVGYDYTVTGGPNFASVLIPDPLPGGDSEFILELGGFGNFPLIAGTAFDFLILNPLGFSSFRISGIDPNELLDPTNPIAFVTGLTFTDSGTVNVTQTPIVQNVPASTPEPSSLVGLGLLGLGFSLKRRK